MSFALANVDTSQAATCQIHGSFGTFGYYIRALLVGIRLDSHVYIWRLLTVELVNTKQVWLDMGWLNLCKLNCKLNCICILKTVYVVELQAAPIWRLATSVSMECQDRDQV